MMRASVFHPSPLLLLAVALVALAVFFAPGAQPASADHDEGTTIWSATLTVAVSGSHRGCGPNTGVACTAALTEVDFTYGGVSYQIEELRVFSGTLIFELNKTVPDNIKSTATLQLGSRTFAFASGGSTTVDVTNDRVTWTNSGLSWSAGDTVSVSLTAPPPTGVELSTDSMIIGEGGGGAFTVTLTADPGADTTVTLVKSRPDSFVTISPATLTFTAGTSGNWGTAQTVTVTGTADLDARDERLMILVLVEVTAKGSGVFHAVNNPTANDNAGYRVVGPSGNAVSGIYVTVRDILDGRPAGLTGLPGHRLIEYGGATVGSAESQKTGWVIQFSWSAPSGHTVGSYNFQHRKRGGAWQQTPGPTSTVLVSIPDTSVTIRPGYSDDTVVDYRVRARKDGVAGDWVTGSVTLNNPRNLVTSVRAVPGGDGELNVSWRPPAIPAWPATTYDVAYREETASGQDADDPSRGWVALDPVSGLSTTIGSLEPGVAYRVRVRITSEYDFAWSFGGGTTRSGGL